MRRVVLMMKMYILLFGTAILGIYELAGVYSLNVITVQPGPVQVKQGKNVSLCCKLKYDPKPVVPVNWQSPPNFKTRTHDCDCYENPKDKYAMSCSDTIDHFGFYNMTIMDVEWADNGIYRCLYTNHMSTVDLQVLVPVTDVTLDKVIHKFTAEPQHLFEYFTCTTNCASPAPKISWSVNDQTFNGKTMVSELGCSGAKKGQKRIMSTVIVVSTDMDEERKEYNISCTAENVIGEPKVSKAITVNNVVPVTDVTLKKRVSLSTAEEPQRYEYFTCTTNCASPAPKILWFVNDQPFNGDASVSVSDCSGAKEGQKRTESTVLVVSPDMEKERKEYKMSCTAENVIGEPKVSEAITVNNVVNPGPPQLKMVEVASAAATTALSPWLVTAIIIIAVLENYRQQLIREH
ncbi:uncharacterized protein LOC135502405 [Lineus longissimus]|uniref:uncharacterized protein LOC135502405 n=1 Tax=Lineus longissimus TaxID=88925 RepID=UPI00315C4ECF